MLKKLSKLMSRILGTAGAPSARDTRRPGQFRPAVETLEDRCVPATIQVTTFSDVVSRFDGKTSLREAITQANRTPAADTIELRAGTYKITRLGTDNTNKRGDFDVTKSL